MSETSFKEDFLNRGFSKGVKRKRKSPLDEYLLEIHELYEDGYALKTIHKYLTDEKDLKMSLETFSSAFRRLRDKRGLNKDNKKDNKDETN